MIYTTNAVESLNMSLRKLIKMRGSFPNEEAALKLLYLALKNAAPGLVCRAEPLQHSVAGSHVDEGTRVTVCASLAGETFVNRAMEMTELWKANIRLSTSPWKYRRRREIPTHYKRAPLCGRF